MAAAQKANATQLIQKYKYKTTIQKTTIMTRATKENIQILSAVAMLFGGFALSVAGFIVPPTGQIHESVLGIFAECLIYAGSIFGVTIYIQTKYAELRSYLDNKIKDEEHARQKQKKTDTQE